MEKLTQAFIHLEKGSSLSRKTIATGGFIQANQNLSRDDAFIFPSTVTAELRLQDPFPCENRVSAISVKQRRCFKGQISWYNPN